MASPNLPFSVGSSTSPKLIGSSPHPFYSTLRLFASSCRDCQRAVISKHRPSHSRFYTMPNPLISLTSVTGIDLLGSSDHATKFSSLSPVFSMHLHLELSFSFTAHPLEFPATQYSFNHFLN